MLNFTTIPCLDAVTISSVGQTHNCLFSFDVLYIQAFVNKPDYIQVVKADIPPPPLVLMALNLRTVPNPKTHQNEVTCYHI